MNYKRLFVVTIIVSFFTFSSVAEAGGPWRGGPRGNWGHHQWNHGGGNWRGHHWNSNPRVWRGNWGHRGNSNWNGNRWRGNWQQRNWRENNWNRQRWNGYWNQNWNGNNWNSNQWRGNWQQRNWQENNWQQKKWNGYWNQDSHWNRNKWRPNIRSNIRGGGYPSQYGNDLFYKLANCTWIPGHFNPYGRYTPTRQVCY